MEEDRLVAKPWPPLTSLKHFVAFPNCSMARLVGFVASARDIGRTTTATSTAG